MQSMQEHRIHTLFLSHSYEISYVGKGQLSCGQGMWWMFIQERSRGWVTQPELHILQSHSAFLAVPGHVWIPKQRDTTAANCRREVPAAVADLGLRGSFQHPITMSSAVSCEDCCPPDKSWEMRTKELKPKKLCLHRNTFESILIKILTKWYSQRTRNVI